MGRKNQIKRIGNRLLGLFLSAVLILGLIPAIPMPNAQAAGSGESWWDPILIDSMDKLIDELSKETSQEQITYYRLTQDVSYDTRLEKFMGAERDPNKEDAAKIDYKTLSQCVVGKGKKHLELMGHDVHYKNNINIGQHFNDSSKWHFSEGWKKIDSLTFFYLPEGAKLIVSNTSKESGQIWYDGRMNDRTGFFDGPRYSFTAVRDVFRVEAGAELTLNNTDVKAGRNRKIWMLNSYYISKEPETNLIASLTWVGNAYEQIYGSCVVVNGGKVTINGGLFDARGGYRDGYNVTGGNKEFYDNAFKLEPYYFETDKMIERCLTNVGPKAAVQIAGEGSQVIINDGEFWGNGGANAIGINSLNSRWRKDITDYQLEIHAGTFDTSKTDKERLPDHCSEMSGNGIFYTVAENFDMWGDCRVTRDTPRGYIGIPAKDGRGNAVVDLSKSNVYIDDEEPEDQVTTTEDADFFYKSDSDTIIIKPKEKDTYFSERENRLGQKPFAIYATDVTCKNMLGVNYEGGNRPLAYEQGLGTQLWFTAESMFDLTDADNEKFFHDSMRAICTWTLYEVTLFGDENRVVKVETTSSVMNEPTLQYVKDGKMLYVYKMNLDNWQRKARSSYNWKQDDKVRYYMTASVSEYFAGSRHTIACQMDNSNNFTYGTEREYDEGLSISFPVSFQNNLRDAEGAVQYSNACYGCDPQIILSQELQDLKKSKGETFVYQWQVLRDGQWEDYGNWRIIQADAIDMVEKHYHLLGETVRLKITGYDKKIKGELYSNACKVLEGRDLNNVEVPAVEVSYDPNHEGKYVFTILVENDWQEYLVLPSNGDTLASRSRYLDWSTATQNKVIDNLDSGTYDIFTRYAAVEGMEAGKKVAWYREMALVRVPAEDAQITYRTRTAAGALPTRKDPVLSDGDEFYVVVGGDVRTFDCVSVPFEANDGTEGTTIWKTYPYSDASLIQPMTVQHDRSTGTASFVETDWGTGIEGRTFMFKGLKQGICHLRAETTLPNGTVKRTTINIFVANNDTVPYKITEASEGEVVRLSPGKSYVPTITAYPETAQSTVETAGRVVWSMVARNEGDDLSHFTLNRSTGELTVSEEALIGEGVIVTGSCRATRDITINATYEVAVSELGRDEDAHPGEDHAFVLFRSHDENQHYEICSCGESRLAAHHYQDEILATASYTSTGTVRHVCAECGYCYDEEIPMIVHTHNLFWNYDEAEHWQNCDDEDCPNEGYEVGRGAHDFVLSGTTEYGQKIYQCSVCGAIKSLGEGEMERELSLNFTHTCTVGNDLSLNYYVESAPLEGYNNVRLVVKKKKYQEDGSFEWKTKTISTYGVGNTGTDGAEEYKFTYSGIFAYEMGDELIARVVAEKDGENYVSDSDVYCIKKYAYNNLKKTTVSNKLKTLLVDMLNYGAEAQAYFNYNTTDYVNAELTDEMKAFGTTGDPALTSYKETKATEGATARFNGHTLITGSNIELKYYMKFNDGVKLDNVSMKMSYTATDGTPHEVVIPAERFSYDAAENEYSCKISTVATKDFSCKITAGIYDGETLISDTDYYSIGSYITNQLKKSTTPEVLKKLLGAMGRYGVSAENYFKK